MPSRYPASWMWAEACEMLEQAERLHRQFFQLGGRGSTRPIWEPPADIVETEQVVKITVALPGVPADRIAIRAEAGTLIVVAERPMPPQVRQGAIRRLEIPYGRFERRIELPSGRFELGYQQVVDGCVHVELRRI